MSVELYDEQEEALKYLKTGSILCGGVGLGKSITALEYYNRKNDKDIYIITTAKKRDSLEWNLDARKVGIFDRIKMVDSWNNVSKYINVQGCDFIFDEQRVIGKGTWVKSFIKIAKNNEWILLSATPGDCWMDYIPVFIANGFYKNRTEFIREHVVYKPFTQFLDVDYYVGEKKLEFLRKQILVDINSSRHTIRNTEIVKVEYDKLKYRDVMKERWNYEKDKPIESPAELCYLLRKICNTHESRINKFLELFIKHKRIIVFYNYVYEKDFLKEIAEANDIYYHEWNGQKHQPVPEKEDAEEWLYFVQYISGSEGWNCISTNVVLFWSYSYSYRQMEQAAGRIDRINTPFTDLYYYYFCTNSNIDLSIRSAVKKKKIFNEREFQKQLKK